MAENNCIFCNFDKQFILEETEHAFAAYFNCAIREGHVVIALREHVTLLSQLTTEQSADIMNLATKIARNLEGIINAEKYYLVSIADETPHYHIHLLPKMPGDPPIGPHIMGQKGWRGEVGADLLDEDFFKLISAYRNIRV